jgi:hypothetical protein
MRRFWIAFLVVLLLALAAYGPRTRAVASSHSHAAAAKKKCVKVTKVVRGKRTTVKKCTTVAAPTPTPTFPPTLTPTPYETQGVADGIADDVTQAADPDDRYHAVAEAMQQLHVGVYTSDGSAVYRGGESGPDDLYVYDFELRGIAASIDQNRTWGMDDVARILNAEHIQTSDGKPFDAASATQLIESALQSAMAVPHDPTTLPLLLIRSLGLRHQTPYDLAQGVLASQIQLDALQLAIITMEFDIPLAQKARAPGTFQVRAHAGKSSSGGGSENQCGDGIMGDTTWRFMPLSVQDPGSSVISQLSTSLHQILVGMMDIGFSGQTPSGTSTQYGGQPLKFVATASLLYSPEEQVQCGVLANLNLPSAGPLPGAQVTWSTGGLEKYGTITYTPAGGATDNNGASTLDFQPKADSNPAGPSHTDSGETTASVVSVTIPKPDPSLSWLFNLAGLSPLTFKWQITYHGSSP